MKRTPLRRTGLRRTPIKRWQRAEEDKVTLELVAYLRRRDRTCIAFRLDPTHRCRDQWGNEHRPDNVDKLTIEHVKDNPRMGGPRAFSDKWHTTLACWDANVNGWCSANREEIKALLRRIEPRD